MVKDSKIKIIENGPYLVEGSIPLLKMIIVPDEHGDPFTWKEIQRYPQKENCTLCRCGKSASKPYCDNSHIKTRFHGTEKAGNEPYIKNAKVYLGPEIKLTDEVKLCSGASFCTRDAGIWNLVTYSERPGFKDLAIEEASNCPSGRLVVWDMQGNPIEPSHKHSIVVTEHEDGTPGPLWVRGGIEIESANGIAYEKRNRVTLCTCGKSANKPFCDASHLDT